MECAIILWHENKTISKTSLDAFPVQYRYVGAETVMRQHKVRILDICGEYSLFANKLFTLFSNEAFLGQIMSEIYC